MIIEFVLQNHRSFRDECRFSMVASSDDSHLGNTFVSDALGKERLLRTAVIYGANAAGKSSLFDAIQFFCQFAANSDLRAVDAPIPVFPFQLDDTSKLSPSKFELTYISNDIRYQYGFTADRHRVHEEWLYAYPKRHAQHLYGRTWNDKDKDYDWYFGPNFRDKRTRLEKLTRPNALLLSVAARYNHEQCTEALKGINPAILPHSGRNTSQDWFIDVSAELAQNHSFVYEGMSQILRVADLGIANFTSEKSRRFNEEDIPSNWTEEQRSMLLEQSQTQVQLGHITSDPDRIEPFPFDFESSGTRRLFGLSGPLWVSRHGKESSMVIDELDESLHPTLVRWIVEFFHNVEEPEINKAQLIFNTHDTTLLDLELFRRDQIWFVEKDRNGSSHLYPLLDYSPRRDEALAKGYLRGRYGAIPFLDPLNGIGGSEHNGTMDNRDNIEDQDVEK